MTVCIITTKGYKGFAVLHKGRPLSDVPVTYKKVCVLGHSMGDNYNPSTLTLYKNRQGVFKYEIYRDGSIYPFYGTIKFIKDKKSCVSYH